MDIITLKDALKRHREQLLKIMGRCELQRERLQNELSVKAFQGEIFEEMRPLHDEITNVAREYWSAYGRVSLIDQVLEILQGRREGLMFDDVEAPVPTTTRKLGPWARCAEETCPPFPPWA